MAVFSVIKLSELEGARRIDAEYYKPEYLWVKSLPNAVPLRKIINDIRYGLYVEPEYKETGINFIRALNLLCFWIDGEILKIEESKVPNDYKLNVGDCLIVRSGANTGSIGFVFPIFQGSTFGSYTIKISFNKINPAYGAIFLASKYGLSQAVRLKTGSAQLNLNIPNILQIKVPILSENIQKEIENIAWQAYELQQISQSIYSQAESLLLEELGLKDFKPEYKKTYTAKLSDAFSAHRIDAEYFQPAYEEVIEKLRENNIELQPLRKFILSIQKGIEPGSENYQDEGKPFIRVSNLSKYGFTDRDQKYLREELYLQLRETYEPKQGDFLLTKDATPGIAYVVKEQIEGIISSGILRLQINENEIDKEYLALCINSIIGKMQVERDCGGSVILHWKPEQVKRLKIPILPFKTQQKIASLVQQSHEARKKAKELLEIAKRAVEIAIEENEEKAQEYIQKEVKS